MQILPFPLDAIEAVVSEFSLYEGYINFINKYSELYTFIKVDN